METTINQTKCYEGEELSNIAYPLGGMGAGMFCMEGTGALTQFSLRHAPNLTAEHNIFAALAIKDGGTVTARVLEGPVPRRKIWNTTDTRRFQGKAAGLSGRNFGLPRFADCTFNARFPFASIVLRDAALPVKAAITGWSPFVPNDDLLSCLPGATVEYTLSNTGESPLECVFYFAAINPLGLNNQQDSVWQSESGFTMSQAAGADAPWEEGHLRVATESETVYTDTAWFRGGWFDPFTMVWNQIKNAQCVQKQFDDPGARSAGGTLAVPFALQPGESKTVRLHFTWYVPESNLRQGEETEEDVAAGSAGTYKPWYAARFGGIDEVTRFYRENVEEMRRRTMLFTDTLYAAILPDGVLEAVGANLCILKSPTILRQYDGRLWCWEGCHDNEGSCYGSCTHVWNYAQAICHLFPQLERSLRQTEFNENQDERGHQVFRASLPIRPTKHDFHAAADGQLGGVMKMYRDWQISGDTEWMLSLWPKVKQSLAYCIAEWDPADEGVIRQPHHNTYDIEFFGAEPLCTLMYLGALKAAAHMATAAGETDQAAQYEALREAGAAYVSTRLFNGEYLFQAVEWEKKIDESVLTPSFGGTLSPEALALIQEEGPKYQYGMGCLSDGVLGAWKAALYGLGDVMPRDMVRAHLQSIFKYNLNEDLSAHANTQRPGYAIGADGGLLLCSWPRGGKPSLPFVYSDEVWTGIEYQVASHLVLEGFVEEGLAIVRTLRKRYDGADRNPFNEYECGHWYARALASYALFQSFTGARYEKTTRVLYIKPAVAGDVQALLSFDGGYGLAGVKDGKPFFRPVEGTCDIERIVFEPKV